MSKKSAVTPTKVLTPRQVSRWQKERRRQKITTLIGSAVIVVIVGTLGYGIFSSRIAPRWQPAIRVNNTTFNLEYVVDYLRVALATQQQSRTVQIVQKLAPSLAEEIQDEQIINEAAPGLGISVSDDEVNQGMRDSVTNADEKGKLSEDQIQQRLRQFMTKTGVPESFLKQIRRNSLTRKKLQDQLESKVPDHGEQVKLSGILVDTEAVANDVLARLKSGSDFAALAKELSTDTGTKDSGGDLGWVPRGLYPEAEATVFSLPVGAPSSPVKTSSGYYIFLVTDHQSDRPIDADALNVLKSKAMSDWLNEEKKGSHVENFFVDTNTDTVRPQMLSWILQQLKITS